MMDCRGFESWMKAEGASSVLPPEVEAHLGACVPCRRLLTADRRVVDVVAARPIAMPEPLPLRAVRDRAFVASRPRVRTVVWAGGAAAAMAAVLVAVMARSAGSSWRARSPWSTRRSTTHWWRPWSGP